MEPSNDRELLAALIRASDGVLLDLNGTFAFDCDRLGPEEDFGSTYGDLGGTLLDHPTVSHLVLAACAILKQVGRDPRRYETFPTAEEVIAGLGASSGLPDEEVGRLSQVLGRHEVGRVPPSYAAAVHRLGDSARLGLVSNVWSPSPVFVDSLAEAGVHDCFEVLVFSSDHGVIKPSPGIFGVALEAMSLRPDQVLYVGNSFGRDVIGARNAGLSVVWVDAGDHEPFGDHRPDGVVADFRDFVAAVR